MRREPDPVDARAKLVRLTAHGRRCATEFRRAVQVLETRTRGASATEGTRGSGAACRSSPTIDATLRDSIGACPRQTTPPTGRAPETRSTAPGRHGPRRLGRPACRAHRVRSPSDRGTGSAGRSTGMRRTSWYSRTTPQPGREPRACAGACAGRAVLPRGMGDRVEAGPWHRDAEFYKPVADGAGYVHLQRGTPTGRRRSCAGPLAASGLTPTATAGSPRALCARSSIPTPMRSSAGPGTRTVPFDPPVV